MKHGLNTETMERGCVADQPQRYPVFTPCFFRVQSVAGKKTYD